MNDWAWYLELAGNVLALAKRALSGFGAGEAGGPTATIPKFLLTYPKNLIVELGELFEVGPNDLGLYDKILIHP